MKKVFKVLKSVLGGVTKPLPLVGIVKAYKEVRESKWEFEKVIKLASYVLVGIGLWAVILGKITIDDLILFVKSLGL